MYVAKIAAKAAFFMSEKKANIAIIGIGNSIRRDDAVGIVVAKRLAEKLDRDFFEETSVDISLLDLFDRYDKLVLIDSIKSGGPVGSLFEVELKNLPEKKLASAHSRNLLSLIGLARNIGIELDTRLRFFVIEVFYNNEFDENISPELFEKIPSIEKEILEKIEKPQ
jgi:hydrogenase maturation protease